MKLKVLSLIEPWGTLIKSGKKHIETRSWKTNYRGDLYIHTSARKLKSSDTSTDRINHLFQKEELQYGKILCKCTLVDCIFMDNDFLKTISQNKQEYLCGLYEYGRYAWILEDIRPITPIDAKGSLRLWEYETDDVVFEIDITKA